MDPRNTYQFAIQDKAGSVDFTLSGSQTDTAFNTKYAPDKSIWMTGIEQPSSSQVAQRIAFSPFVKTADQWPTLVAGAAAIAVTNKMKSEWRPLASTLVSSVGIIIRICRQYLWFEAFPVHQC
jgi:hypothetical protein